MLGSRGKGGLGVVARDRVDDGLVLQQQAAAILGRDDIGRIEAGCCADVVAFDMSPIGLAGARTDWLSGLLVAGDDTRTSLTMVGGAIRVLHGRLVWEDEQALRARVDATTARLIERAQRLTGLDYGRMGCAAPLSAASLTM